MVAVELICVAVAAMWLGYRLGRRTTTPAAPSWRRMRRSTPAQQAVALMLLLTASQVQRSMHRKLRRVRGRILPVPGR
jgi:hypothetical protein